MYEKTVYINCHIFIDENERIALQKRIQESSTDKICILPPGMEVAEIKKEWISVRDKLPEHGKWAIFTNGVFVSVERFKRDAEDHFYPNSHLFDFKDAVAWMPLPDPPFKKRWASEDLGC